MTLLRAPLCYGTLAAMLFCGGARAGDAPIAADDSGLGKYIKKGPLPPPRIGEQVALPFPPPPAKRTTPRPASKTSPLSIVLHQPDGVEQTPPAVSITFDQPMVAISSAGTVAATVPAYVEPRIDGAWRWLGTSTLSLAPKERMRYATRYRVTVPAGTRSASGQLLAKPFSYTFDTPRPQVTAAQPYANATEVGLTPFIVLTFNQRVTADKIARFVTLRDKAGRATALQPVPRTEWSKSSDISSLVGSREATSATVWKVVRPLVPDTSYRIDVAAGLVGDEGPLEMTKPFTSEFATYPKPSVHAIDCGNCYQPDVTTCTVGQGLCVAFNHGVEPASAEAAVTVTPKPEKLHLRADHQAVHIDGLFRGDTKYSVSIAAGVRDAYGQVLTQRTSKEITYQHRPSEIRPLVESSALIERNGALALPLHVVNVDSIAAHAYRVPDDQLEAVTQAVQYRSGDSTFTDRVKQLERYRALSWREKPAVEKDRDGTHALSLRNLVAQHGPGPYLIVIDRAERPVFVQITDIGLTARYDNDHMVVLATSIASGRPLSGVRVKVVDPAGVTSPAVTTRADGVAELRAVSRDENHAQHELFVVGTLGSDRAFVHASGYGDDQRSVSLNWGRQAAAPYRRTLFYPDRDLYRPGETIEIYAIDRRYQGDSPDRLGVEVSKQALTWTARSSRRRELGTGTAERSAFGTYHFSVKIPEVVDLGAITVETPLGSLSVQVQEYRAPEFEVAVKIPPRPLFVTDNLTATVQGRYLFGAAMRGANVHWSLFAESSRFLPADHQQFHFGSAIHPWHEEYRWRDHGPLPIASGSGKLDASGGFSLETPIGAGGDRLDPMSLVLEAQVSDVSRQLVASRQTVSAHAADRYIGMRTAQPVIEAGKPAMVELVLVDLDGKRVSGTDIQVRIANEAGWTRSIDAAGDDSAPAKTAQTTACTAMSAMSVASCALRFPTAGMYLVEAVAADSKKRPTRSRLYVFVAGRDQLAKDTQARRLELSLDRKEYRPGDTATVTLRSPFAEGIALVTYERRGLLGYQTVKIANYVGTAKVPLRVEQLPNLEVAATAIAARGKERAPAAWATGSTSIAILRAAKELTIFVRPAKETARPGETVAVEVRVVDGQKRPVAAQVSLLGVDEAVLGMSGFQMPDPVAFFHYVREPGVALAELLRLLLPEQPPSQQADKREVSEERSMKAADSGEDAAGLSGLAGVAGGAGSRTRRSFLTTPLAGVVSTDASGKATFQLPLPDNLTRFRLMAVAADATDRFGRGQSAVTVQRPLQLRPSLPRFINTSDTFSASVVVDNQSGKDGEAKVLIAAEGVELVGGALRTISIAAGEAKEAAFQVRAPKPGYAKFHFTVVMGPESDAVERSIPIFTPATTEAFATYGSTTGSVSQPVVPPADALSGYGGLSITLAATALTGLEDAARYLVEYPYGCAEQVSSRAMPILVLGDIVSQFNLGGPEVAALQRKHAAIAIDKLISGQRSDGGWGTWAGLADEGRADLTAYILLVLRRGKDAGLVIPEDTVRRASSFLTNWIASQDKPAAKEPSWRRRWVHDTAALALYALGDWGERHDALAKALYKNGATSLDTFAVGLLAAVFHRISAASPERGALLRELGNRAIQTPAALRFQESQSEALQLLMHSSARTDAIALLVLLEVDPKNAMVDKLVRGLLDARINGRWDTTQSNSYALYALARYWKVYESEPTAFTASMWLGQGYLGESKFESRSMREEHLEIPMQVVKATGARTLTLGKEGSGRLYYRVGMRYAPREMTLAPSDRGFTVARSYEAVENPDDVRHEPDGSWSVRAGSYVRVQLRVVVQDRRYYVVVDDPLPAGMELVNTDYKTSAQSQLDDRRHDPWETGAWRFNHRELRDERSLHFADALEPGEYQLSVVARATSPGTYIVPPTRSEEMYHPEVFGRSATDRMTVR